VRLRSLLTAMAQVSVAQDGIQKLLAAEQEAQQIIAKARKGRCPRRSIAPIWIQLRRENWVH
jgi:Vacuolar (H+)-ATPase G subunit